MLLYIRIRPRLLTSDENGALKEENTTMETRKMPVLAILAALVVATGCPVPRSPRSEKSKSLGHPTTATVVSAPTPTESNKPTEAQKKRNGEILKAVNETRSTVLLPAWVREHLAEFEKRDYTKRRVVFQRSVAWGVGQYNKRSFYWFARTNTDAYMQIDISVALTMDDVESIFRPTPPSTIVTLPERKGEHTIPGTKTWVGLDNKWAEDFCTKPSYEVCDIGGGLQSYLPKLNTLLPGKLSFQLGGRFPW